MNEVLKKRPSRKFLWSHQSTLHRTLVRIANQILLIIPFKLKYAVCVNLKKNSPPYSLVKGAVVVQVGAPFDTLEAGRSRGMIFSHLVGLMGKW